jgi:hypothetical protein
MNTCSLCGPTPCDTLCVCGHTRHQHRCDGDYECLVVNDCPCEAFEESEKEAKV